MIDASTARWIAQQVGCEVHDSRRLSGGSINEVYRLRLSNGENLVLKVNRSAPVGLFAAEAVGLHRLKESDSKVPAVIAVANQMLLLEDLGESRPTQAFWPILARMLANQHQHTSSRFGFCQDNHIGLTEQRNAWTESGVEFFAEHRLRFQIELARDTGLLSTQDIEQLDRLSSRLADWIPEQPAALLHGDLWRGNIHCTGTGEPALIDPACYYGWAEAELAMTTLFGELPEAFYREYQEISGMEPEWRSRAPLYNLYHLLNHLNLFGGSYLCSVRSVLKRYIN